MSKIDKDYKKAVDEEKKTEAQLEALQVHLKEAVVRRKQLAREALINAVEKKKLGRDELFDFVEGISSGKIDFIFREDDEPEDDAQSDEEAKSDVSDSLSRAFEEAAGHEYGGGEQYAE